MQCACVRPPPSPWRCQTRDHHRCTSSESAGRTGGGEDGKKRGEGVGGGTGGRAWGVPGCTMSRRGHHLTDVQSLSAAALSMSFNCQTAKHCPRLPACCTTRMALGASLPAHALFGVRQRPIGRLCRAERVAPHSSYRSSLPLDWHPPTHPPTYPWNDSNPESVTQLVSLSLWQL